MKRKRPIGSLDLGRAAVAALGTHRLRSALAAASMAAAVAAVILVATVAVSGREFVLGQIEGVGSNLVYAYYEAGGNVSAAEADYIDLADVEAVRVRLGPLAKAVAGVMSSWDSVTVEGRPLQIRVLGASEAYRAVRNLEVHAGRFLDRTDLGARARVCLVTPELAATLFGPGADAVGRSLKVHDLDFRVVGVFSEGVETFGQSEVSKSSVLVPATLLRYFQPVERVDPLYVSVRSQGEVEQAARLVRETLEARHRPGSLYRVATLAGVLAAARRIIFAMGLAMSLAASVTLAVSGVFIMNLMLISVSERTAEIGVRKAVGATRREIRLQFLAEAAALAALGGLGGAAIGVGLPWLAGQIWPKLPLAVPPLWVAGALAMALAVGMACGFLPAARAARLDPAEALRHE